MTDKVNHWTNKLIILTHAVSTKMSRPSPPFSDWTISNALLLETTEKKVWKSVAYIFFFFWGPTYLLGNACLYSQYLERKTLMILRREIFSKYMVGALLSTFCHLMRTETSFILKNGTRYCHSSDMQVFVG